jgi:Xaa-Pro aminopeptidase
MHQINIPNSVFKNNRERFSEIIKHNSAFIICANSLMLKSGDQFFPFRQNSNFFYLTGLIEEDIIFCYFPKHPSIEKREIILMQEQDERSKIYDGEKSSAKEMEEISGIANTETISELNKIILDYQKHTDTLYLLFDKTASNKNSNQNLYLDVKAKNLFNQIIPAQEVLAKLRLIKTEPEIQYIKNAIQITSETFAGILQECKSNMYEYDIEALMYYEFIRKGAQGHAFQPIVASGENASVLHYVSNSDKMLDKEMLLIDFGANYNYYAADISRTIPVNGKYTPRQKEVYQEVLNIQKQVISYVKPGLTINDINKYATILMGKSLPKLGLLTEKEIQNQNPESPAYKKYYPHGCSHFLGIDVHDIGDKDTVLEENMLITVEPGIYIKEENIGIRIENNILIGNPCIDLSAGIPREIDVIENLMNISGK